MTTRAEAVDKAARELTEAVKGLAFIGPKEDTPLENAYRCAIMDASDRLGEALALPPETAPATGTCSAHPHGGTDCTCEPEVLVDALLHTMMREYRPEGSQVPASSVLMMRRRAVLRAFDTLKNSRALAPASPPKAPGACGDCEHTVCEHKPPCRFAASPPPAYCDTHQHSKWCQHNGGVMGPTGYEAPPKLERHCSGCHHAACPGLFTEGVRVGPCEACARVADEIRTWSATQDEAVRTVLRRLVIALDAPAASPPKGTPRPTAHSEPIVCSECTGPISGQYAAMFDGRTLCSSCRPGRWEVCGFGIEATNSSAAPPSPRESEATTGNHAEAVYEDRRGTVPGGGPNV